MNKIIDDKIIALNYDPQQILAFHGEKIENCVPYTDGMKNDKYIVVKREVKSTESGTIDIAIINSMTDRTYPGALIFANEGLVNNMPDILNADRAPITLRTNLPMGSEGTVVIQNPTHSAVSEAVNQILTAWENKYATTHHLNANCQYTETKVFSEDQLRVDIGCNFDLLKGSLGIDFTSISKGEKQTFVLSFKQIFYMMSIDAPVHPSDVFAADVSWEELEQKGVKDQNPPAYISNVSYGRTIYVKVETTSNSQEIETTLKALIKNNKIDASVLNNSLLKTCSFTAVILGGDAAAHTEIITTQDFAEIQKIIAGNAELSAKNPGFPVSYTASFLKDGKVAKVNSTADYIEIVSTEYSAASVRLIHKGGYVAKFYIDWEESSFDANGKQVLTPKSWSKNGQELTAKFETVIPLPANAVHLHVKATENTGLAWEGWRTILDQDAKLSPEVLVEIWGTTLNQYGSVTYKE